MNFKELKERFERRLLDEKEVEFLIARVEAMQKTQSLILKRVAEISPALAKSIIHEFDLKGEST